MEETMDREELKGSPLLGVVAAVAGWLVPGLGHLLLRRWSKAAVYFLCIGGLAFAGLAMRGGVFSFGADDLFDRLGFFADLGAGAFYFLAHQIQSAGPDVRARHGRLRHAPVRRRGHAQSPDGPRSVRYRPRGPGKMTSLFGRLNHFQALLFFALVVSLTFAYLSKRGLKDRAQYALWAFLAFLLVAIGIGWLMYPFSQ